MAKNSIEIENGAFSCKQEENVCFVTLNQNAIEILTSNEIKENLHSTLATIDESVEIRGLVITNSPTLNGGTELSKLLAYFSKTFHSKTEDRAVHRLKNATSQLVSLFLNFSIPTIMAMNGEIGQVVFAFSLACDFRFATSNTLFHFPSIELGLPTTGVLPYYLVQYIGLPRSIDLLFTKTSLSAPEAKDLGLLTAVTTGEELITHCIEKLNDINQYPRHGISALKRVLQPNADDINKVIDKAFEEFMFNLVRYKER